VLRLLYKKQVRFCQSTNDLLVSRFLSSPLFRASEIMSVVGSIPDWNPVIFSEFFSPRVILLMIFCGNQI